MVILSWSPYGRKVEANLARFRHFGSCTLIGLDEISLRKQISTFGPMLQSVARCLESTTGLELYDPMDVTSREAHMYTDGGARSM